MCELSPIPFHGDTIFCVTLDDQPFAPVKPIVVNMGLDWGAQSTKLRANKERWGIANIAIPSESGEQETTCLPVRKLPAFLASINPKKVRPELREKIELYQAECDDALWAYWTEGRAERQPQPEPTSLPPADSPLTPDQQCTLRAIVKSKVEALPAEQRTGRGLYPQIWSRFNNHFRLGSYKQLPQCRLSEAIEYLMQLDLTPQPKALPGGPAPVGLSDGVDGLALTPEQARLVPHSLPKFELELSQGINSLTLLCERMALFGAPSGFSTASHYRNRPLIDAIVENTRSARASCVAALHMLKSVRLICAGTR